jgi:hypothetical protein
MESAGNPTEFKMESAGNPTEFKMESAGNPTEFWVALTSGSSEKKTRKSDLKRRFQSQIRGEAQVRNQLETKLIARFVINGKQKRAWRKQSISKVT